MRNRIFAGLLAIAVGTWVGGLSAAAETYKWTDAEGKVHYSDQPPPGAKQPVTTLNPKRKSAKSAPAPAPDAKPGVAPKSYVEQDAEFRKRKVEAAEKEAADKKAAQEAADKKRNCERAKAQLAGLQDGGRITRYNDKGEKEFLSDAQIAEEIARARQSADSWCK